MDYKITRLVDVPERINELAEWFSSKWGIPKEAYLESMDECLRGNTVPQWYAIIKDERIVCGAGVIANDFHDRVDLTPNVCAVYTEEDMRSRGLAGTLLNFICKDMSERGIDTLYLLTDHDSFYERYGWEFYCMAQGDGEANMSRMYVHRQEN